MISANNVLKAQALIGQLQKLVVWKALKKHVEDDAYDGDVESIATLSVAGSVITVPLHLDVADEALDDEINRLSELLTKLGVDPKDILYPDEYQLD